MPRTRRHHVFYRWRQRSSERWKYFHGTVELLDEYITIERYLERGLSEDTEVLHVGPEYIDHTPPGRWLWTDRCKKGDVPKKEER